MAELKGFVFALTFIVLFSAFIGSIPAGLQGTGATPDTLVNVNPDLTSGFAYSTNYSISNFTTGIYEYELNSRDWIALADGTHYELARKVYLLGTFWLGQIEGYKFVSKEGSDRGTELTYVEMTSDSSDGQSSYNIISTSSGNSGGTLICYWDTGTYDNATEAYTAGELWFVHGIGIVDSIGADILPLMIQLLTLSIPDVPVLLGIMLAIIPYSSILFLIWFIIKETLPFV